MCVCLYLYSLYTWVLKGYRLRTITLRRTGDRDRDRLRGDCERWLSGDRLVKCVQEGSK